MEKLIISKKGKTTYFRKWKNDLFLKKEKKLLTSEKGKITYF